MGCQPTAQPQCRRCRVTTVRQRARVEPGADLLARERLGDERRRRDEHGGAGLGGDAGGGDLGLGSPGADAGPADRADLDPGELVAERHVGDALGTVEVRRPRVQRVDVGEQHEQVGVDELGDERGEPVVVAEADLVRGDRVVLVHDRQDPQPEQALHRALGVAAGRRVLEVARGQQHLARRRSRSGRG